MLFPSSPTAFSAPPLHSTFRSSVRQNFLSAHHIWVRNQALTKSNSPLFYMNMPSLPETMLISLRSVISSYSFSALSTTDSHNYICTAYS